MTNRKGQVLAQTMLEKKRLRTRSLIQLGGLVTAVGLDQIFDVELGLDLQKDPTMKDPTAALVGALLMLKDIIQGENMTPALLVERGLKFMAYHKDDNQNAQGDHND